jgi:hypothetical protein
VQPSQPFGIVLGAGHEHEEPILNVDQQAIALLYL